MACSTKSFAVSVFGYDTEVSASRGINIQRLILAEIVAVLSAPLLVLGSKGLLRPGHKRTRNAKK